jgi:hypothetical protein
VFPSDLPGVNPATLNRMVLYYRLMTKWSGLGDGTELSRVGLSQLMQLLCFLQVVCMHSSREETHWFRGACMCVGGALCGFSSFGLVVCALCFSLVLSRMCRAVALA